MIEVLKIMLIVIGLVNIVLSIIFSWKYLREESFKARTIGILFVIWGTVL